VPVSVEVEAIDAGDAAPLCSVTALNAETTVEWLATSGLAFEIRSNASTPRALRVQVSCVDGAGNRATVNVPMAIAKGRPAKVN